MLRIAPAALAIALLSATTPLHASVQIGDYVKLSRGTNQGTGGGAFDVDDLNDLPAVPLDFKTFCAEITEHISLGSTYYVYDISNHNDINGGLGLRTLGTTAAWLYTQFRQGDILLHNQNEENALQLGIWRGMLDGSNLGYSDANILAAVAGQPGWNGGATYITSTLNPLLTGPTGWFTTLAADYAAWQSNGPSYIGDVRIMNLKTSPTGSYVQDQLIWTPPPLQVQASAPEPGAIAVWSGLAALGLLATRRRARLSEAR